MPSIPYRVTNPTPLLGVEGSWTNPDLLVEVRFIPHSLWKRFPQGLESGTQQARVLNPCCEIGGKTVYFGPRVMGKVMLGRVEYDRTWTDNPVVNQAGIMSALV